MVNKEEDISNDDRTMITVEIKKHMNDMVYDSYKKGLYKGYRDGFLFVTKECGIEYKEKDFQLSLEFYKKYVKDNLK